MWLEAVQHFALASLSIAIIVSHLYRHFKKKFFLDLLFELHFTCRAGVINISSDSSAQPDMGLLLFSSSATMMPVNGDE